MGNMNFDIVVNRNELMKKINSDNYKGNNYKGNNYNHNFKKRYESTIKREGDILVLNKLGIIEIIKDNKDTSSKVPDSDLIKMIELFYGRLSIKQENWICEKVKYVIRNNPEYRKLRGIKDMQFI
jgi:hypothetical protein